MIRYKKSLSYTAATGMLISPLVFATPSAVAAPSSSASSTTSAKPMSTPPSSSEPSTSLSTPDPEDCDTSEELIDGWKKCYFNYEVESDGSVSILAFTAEGSKFLFQQNDGEVSFPDEIDGKPVKTLGYYNGNSGSERGTFNNVRKIKRFPAHLREIKEFAFSSPYLVEVADINTDHPLVIGEVAFASANRDRFRDYSYDNPHALTKEEYPVFPSITAPKIALGTVSFNRFKWTEHSAFNTDDLTVLPDSMSLINFLEVPPKGKIFPDAVKGKFDNYYDNVPPYIDGSKAFRFSNNYFDEWTAPKSPSPWMFRSVFNVDMTGEPNKEELFGIVHIPEGSTLWDKPEDVPFVYQTGFNLTSLPVYNSPATLLYLDNPDDRDKIPLSKSVITYKEGSGSSEKTHKVHAGYLPTVSYEEGKPASDEVSFSLVDNLSAAPELGYVPKNKIKYSVKPGKSNLGVDIDEEGRFYATDPEALTEYLRTTDLSYLIKNVDVTYTVDDADGEALSYTKTFKVKIFRAKSSFIDSLGNRYEGDKTVLREDKISLSFPKSNPYIFDDAKYAWVEPEPDWLKINPANGDISGRVPKDAPFGDIEKKVRVTYNDGSTKEYPIKLTVAKISDKYELVYDKPEPVMQESVTSYTLAGSDTSHESEGVKYSLTEGKTDWMSINAKTGAITANPNLATQPRDYEVNIVATYSDGSEDVKKLTITVEKKPDKEIYQPGVKGDAPSVLQSEEGTSKVEAVGKDFPAGTKFSVEAPFDTWVSVDKTSGVVKFSPNFDVDAGNKEPVITVMYPDESSETVVAPVKVLRLPDNQRYNEISYPNALGSQGKVTDSEAPQGEFPSGTRFVLEEGSPSWASMANSADNTDGRVRISPHATTPEGTYTIHVKVHFPDQTESRVPIQIKITSLPDNQVYHPVYSKGYVFPGDTSHIPAPVSLPARIQRVEGVDLPEWVKLNSTTGDLTIEPSKTEPAGLKEYNLVVTYEDGSTAEIPVSMEVQQADSEFAYDLRYPKVPSANPDDSSVTVDLGNSIPVGLKAKTCDDTVEWAQVNPDTGQVTADIPHYLSPGNKYVRVCFYKESSPEDTFDAFATINVKDMAHNQRYETHYANPDETHTVNTGHDLLINRPLRLPANARLELDATAPKWAYIDNHQRLLLRPIYGETPRSTYTIRLRVVYADNTTAPLSVRVRVV